MPERVEMVPSRPETLIPGQEQGVEPSKSNSGFTNRLPEVGTSFAGRYTILRELGQGGMGAVFLAHDKDLDRDVALKIPSLGNADDLFFKRFRREARVGAQFGHDVNICRILDVNQFDGVPYLTMDYVSGQTLSDVIKDNSGGLPVPDAVRLVRTLAKSLGEVHSHGIVHRDLKPSNIMIRSDGTPVLMDFGLARGETDEQMTTGVIGTPAYMSPEQAKGDTRIVSPSTDIYSLGVILFESLTGHRPFEDSTARVLLYRIVYDPPKPPTTLRGDLDPRLDAICLKAMAKSPGERFSTMAELTSELDRFLSAAGSPGGTTHRPASRSTRPRVLAGLVAMLALGFLASGYYLYGPQRPRTEPGSNRQNPTTENGISEPSDLVAKRPVSVPERPEVARPEPPRRDHRELAIPRPSAPKATLSLVSEFTGMTFVLIKPGEFKMGSPRDEGQANEHPQHPVMIRRPFLLGQYEVTQAEYQNVTGENPSHFEGIDRRPVERVSWLDALRFCNALSLKDGLMPFYTIEGDSVTVTSWLSSGYRLPTEAEWEYACRAGLLGKFGFASDARELGDHAWYRENSQVNDSYETHVVGGKKPNGFGLYDMQGNVWEWCWDWYAETYDPQSPSVDPTGPPTGRYRVLRGGTYRSPAGIVRCAIRNQDDPESKIQVNGFRVARTVPEE
jgi:serine/threonine protein kinase